MSTSNQDSILNVEVSSWANYFEAKNPKPVNLLNWLNSSKYAHQVEAIRKAETKEERDVMKAKLPAITPSGTFTSREEIYLIQHSGLIQIDIDFKDNTHIANFSELKQQLTKVQNIAYIGLSVSGTGFWGLIPILYPDKHKQHFKALKNDFLSWGINLDEKPGNVASLRGYSWDPKGYFNHNAIKYAKLYESKPETYKPISTKQFKASSEAEKVEAVLKQIESRCFDITEGYGNWFALGCSLANSFNEAGRDYFHRLSQYNTGYKQEETDKQFNRCLLGKYPYTVSTFFEVAKKHGFTWKEVLVQPITKPVLSQPIAKHSTLPPGMKLIGRTLEVDGLPFGWLNDKEQEEANERLQAMGMGVELSKDIWPTSPVLQHTQLG